MLLWSPYEGYKNEAAVRELILAQQLNPAIGHSDLAAIYQHMGLEDLASHELQRALDIDPTSQTNNDLVHMIHHLGGKYDEWFAASQKLSPGRLPDAWYLLGKNRLDEAEKAIDRMGASTPDDPDLLCKRALLFALRGDFRAAESEVPRIFAKEVRNDLSYHHCTYDTACIYALAGKNSEAVKWLKETAATGFPNYPLFERDHFLDGIRQTPEFLQFMAQERAQWEQARQEFGE
jgi:tetratricopeptide (TPR) repeat protein